MTLISHPQATEQKCGVVEIFNFKDYQEIIICLDGELFYSCSKQCEYILSPDFMYKLSKRANIPEDSLLFFMVEWEEFITQEYGADSDYLQLNRFNSYADLQVPVHNLEPNFSDFYVLFAIGYTSLYQKIFPERQSTSEN